MRAANPKPRVRVQQILLHYSPLKWPRALIRCYALCPCFLNLVSVFHKLQGACRTRTCLSEGRPENIRIECRVSLTGHSPRRPVGNHNDKSDKYHLRGASVRGRYQSQVESHFWPLFVMAIAASIGGHGVGCSNANGNPTVNL
jgi:hypothetical protein